MAITFDEALHAAVFLDSDGKRWRRNGRTQTWKTRPGEFRIPVKHGLYAYGQIRETQAHLFTVEDLTNG